MSPSSGAAAAHSGAAETLHSGGCPGGETPRTLPAAGEVGLAPPHSLIPIRRHVNPESEDAMAASWLTKRDVVTDVVWQEIEPDTFVVAARSTEHEDAPRDEEAEQLPGMSLFTIRGDAGLKTLRRESKTGRGSKKGRGSKEGSGKFSAAMKVMKVRLLLPEPGQARVRPRR